MSYEQRKANRQKREKRYKILIISLGIVLITIIIASLFNRSGKTILPSEEIFLNEVEMQGVLIKDEKVYKLSETKDIDIESLEGKKINVGTQVGNSTLLNDISLLKKEVSEIDNAIDTIKKSDKDIVFQNNKKNLIENFNKNVEKLQESIYIEDYIEISDYKRDIILIEKEIDDLLPQNSLLGQSIDSLNAKKESLKKEINQKDSSYISKSSGILSYEIDGYEGLYKAEDFESYTYDKLIITDKKIDDFGKVEEASDIIGFKIIDNFQWYLALKVEDRKKIPKYEIGDNITLNYDLNGEIFELSGNIIAINNTSNKAVIILKFNKYLHEFYNIRFPKVKLTQNKSKVFKIPNSVILEENGRAGVYIKDFSGIVRFKAIKIIKTIGDYTYIDKGKDGIITIGDDEKTIETISIYDEIFLKPYRFKEGQIIN